MTAVATRPREVQANHYGFELFTHKGNGVNQQASHDIDYAEAATLQPGAAPLLAAAIAATEAQLDAYPCRSGDRIRASILETGKALMAAIMLREVTAQDQFPY